MAYRIFFSGLVFYVRRGALNKPAYDHVDVLLLNPCEAAGHQHPVVAGAVGGHSHGAETCTDHHFAQMSVKYADVAEFDLPGVVHGCGWHHFDMSGRTLFPQGPNRQIDVTDPQFDEITVDPIGLMRHVAYQKGVPDMSEILKDFGRNAGRIDLPEVTGMVQNLTHDLVAARVRLPRGQLTALVQVDNSPKRAATWTIGGQTLEAISEVVMFVPASGADNRLEFDGGGSVTLRNKPDVTVWISCEPLQFTRSTSPHQADHFVHYYDLLPTGPGSAVGAARAAGGRPTPVPNFPPNNGDPLCPGSGGEEDPPGLP
jgi:hypothetical protein